MEYGITWLLFDMPQFLVEYVFIPFVDFVSTSFNDVFPWFEEFWSTLYGMGEDVLQFFDKFIDIDWIISFFYDQSNFFANIGELPVVVVVLAYIIRFGIIVSLIYYCLDVARKINPLVGN